MVFERATGPRAPEHSEASLGPSVASKRKKSRKRKKNKKRKTKKKEERKKKKEKRRKKVRTEAKEKRRKKKENDRLTVRSLRSLTLYNGAHFIINWLQMAAKLTNWLQN